MASVNLRDLLDAEPGGARVTQLSAWIPYREDFEVLLKHASAEEQRRHLAKAGKGGKTPSIRKQSDFWLAHVLDWRGLTDGDGTPIEYSERRLRNLWDLDSEFAAWIVEESQKLDSFLGATPAAETPGGVAE